MSRTMAATGPDAPARSPDGRRPAARRHQRAGAAGGTPRADRRVRTARSTRGCRSTQDRARGAARAADDGSAAATEGRAGAVAALPPLLGIPVALKDLVVTRGRPSTAGSRILEGFVGPYDAHIAERLDAAGAVVPGKTNMDEFAMGSSTEHSAFGPDRQPMGSRPRAGRQQRGIGRRRGGVPRAARHRHRHGRLDPPAGRADGHRGHASQRTAASAATASSPSPARSTRSGPFGRDTRDAALLLGAIAGHDERDSTSAPVPVPDYAAALPDERRRGGGIPAGHAPGTAAGVLRQGHGARRRGARAGGRRRARGRRRGDRRRRPAAHRLRPRDLLHHRPRRGVGEPGALRRHPIRPLGARRRRAGQLPGDARPGLRR